MQRIPAALIALAMVQPNPPGGVIDGTRHLYAVRVYYEDTDLSVRLFDVAYIAAQKPKTSGC